MNFNKAQLGAIEHKDGAMLVLAGPGSGKTAVITHRTKNLITKHHVKPSEILVITFTKAAANEMKERFNSLMKDERVNVSFGTFHAVFFTILKYAYRFTSERIEKLEYDMKLISRMNPYASINYIRRGIGYDDFLAEYAEYRNINKEDLFDILDEIQSGAKGFATYEEWYEHIREYTKQMKLMALSKESDPNAVTLATLHSSKGLEFENVYIIDANEGIMPYKKAVLEKDIEEERRLFYVGMTRAKTSLSVYSVKSVNDKSAQASRFVRESKEPRQNNSRDD